MTPTAFDFGPDGSVFAEPVTLTLGYKQSEIPDGVDESELVMLASSHDSAEMVPVAGMVTVSPHPFPFSRPKVEERAISQLKLTPSAE